MFVVFELIFFLSRIVNNSFLSDMCSVILFDIIIVENGGFNISVNFSGKISISLFLFDMITEVSCAREI